jgi:hypothetical protein
VGLEAFFFLDTCRGGDPGDNCVISPGGRSAVPEFVIFTQLKL